jgi:hypothetical protein
MGTKSRETIYSASVRAAAERAAEARKEADRLACEAWNKRMLGFQGPAQPSPALGDALNAGYGYLEVRCLGCDTHQTVALDMGGERFAVMPADALAQWEGQLCPVRAPQPGGRQIGHDRIETVLFGVLIEHDQIIEHAHHRSHRESRRLFMDRRAGGTVGRVHPKNAASAWVFTSGSD